MKTNILDNPSNIAVFTALTDGRYYTAIELGTMTGLDSQSIAAILNQLLSKKIVTVRKSGSHQYYGIQDKEMIQEIKAELSNIATIKIKPLKKPKDKELLNARTCYHHLAGNLGVKITDALISLNYLKENKDGFVLTEKGKEFFQSFGIDVDGLQADSNRFSPKCLDFSERRSHLSGLLGSAILDRLLELHWIERAPKTRVIKVTHAGKKGLKQTFSIELKD